MSRPANYRIVKGENEHHTAVSAKLTSERLHPRSANGAFTSKAKRDEKLRAKRTEEHKADTPEFTAALEKFADDFK